MTIKTYSAGAGASAGHWLATASPLTVSGNIWYVDSRLGVDAASPAGQNAAAPLLSLEQAIDNAADDDIVVLSGSSPQVADGLPIVIDKRLAIVGSGTSNGQPFVNFQRQSADQPLFTITGVGVLLGNIRFLPDAVQCSAPLINVQETLTRIENCYFSADNLSRAECVHLEGVGEGSFGAGWATIRDTTFLATTSQPYCAVRASGAISFITLEGVVFDGGEPGWSNFYALNLSAGAVGDLLIKQCSLLRGADVKIHADSTGIVNFQTQTVGPRVEW
jgi:hypothetical protein